MHNCTSARGYTASMASGNPFSPSTQAMRMSCTPRFFSSVSTCSQNSAPSLCATHNPSTSFTFQVHAQHHVDGLVLNVPFVPHFHHQRVEVHDRIEFFQRPVLPLLDFLEDGIGDVGDQRGRHLHAVDFFQVALDLACGHPPCVHRNDLVVEPRPARLPLRDDLRLEGALAVA